MTLELSLPGGQVDPAGSPTDPVTLGERDLDPLSLPLPGETPVPSVGKRMTLLGRLLLSA